ncbi:MAG: helix-turn-helix domain-containing protein [Coprobacillaceae bacterium]
MLARLMQYPEKIEAYSTISYDKLLSSTIIKYILENYKDAKMNELSGLLHLPDYKICKLIKKTMNTTFTKLVQKVRLERAGLLLETTNLNINTIMQEVGYENISYFYKIFKDQYTITPQEYRKSNKNKDNIAY